MFVLGLDPETGPTDTEDSLSFANRDDGGPPALSRIARYRIIRKIGEGGMGVVYEAEQELPRRTVALKVIKPGFTSPELLHRFELETEALGRLQHPGIAQIYEAGTADTGFGTQPYFAMELIRGISAKAYAQEHHLSTRARLDLIAKIADAVQHAHQRGLIHRDLKPGNILVDETGQPKILDFGVARVMDSDARATLQTDVGQLFGTLAYMSPEQIEADPLKLDARTDVYSLGVILYELLTGRLPYDVGRKVHEAAQVIRDEDPAPLSSIDRMYGGDIETIAAKALEKEKSRRYGSAAELASDIRRYLRDEPIVARPASATYQLRKFARRNRALVTGIAAVFVVLVAGIAVSMFEATRARQERDRALAAQREAVTAQEQAQRATESATRAEQKATAERDRAVAAEQMTAAERNKAAAEQVRADAQTVNANNQRLAAVWQSLARESVRESAGRLDYDRAALLAVQSLLFNRRIPDQPRSSVEEALQHAQLLDPILHNLSPDNRLPFVSVAVSSDGTRMAAGGKDVRLWDLRNPGAPPLILQPEALLGDAHVVFSADGTQLAAGFTATVTKFDGSIRIWDLRNPTARPVMLDAGPVQSLAFAPDGIHLVSGSLDLPPYTINVRRPSGTLMWDKRNPTTPIVLSKTVPAPIPDCVNSFQVDCLANSVNSVTFSPDGYRLAAAEGDAVKLWDTRDFNAPPTSLHQKRSGSRDVFLSVTFSPDGQHLAAAGTDGLQIWDLRNLQSAPSTLPNPPSGWQEFRSVAYSPDGTHLVAACDNKKGEIRGANFCGGLWIWDLSKSGSPPLPIPGNLLTYVQDVAYLRGGGRIAAASTTGVWIWDLERQAGLSQSSPPKETGLENLTSVVANNFAYSADLTHFAHYDKTIRVWDLRNPDKPPVFLSPEGLQGSLSWIVLSSDGTELAATARTRLWLWEGSTAHFQGLSMGTADNSETRYPLVAFSPDGSRLASAGSSVRIFDLRAPEAIPVSMGPLNVFATALAFSTDGTRLAVASGPTVTVWNLRNSGAPPLVLSIPKGGTLNVIAFSTDATRLAASNRTTGQTVVWNLQDGVALQQVVFPRGVRALTFSPDGTRLAGDQYIWDLRTPASLPLALPFPATGGGFSFTVAFSPDGLRLNAGRLTGTVLTRRLWSVAADYLCTRVWRNLSMDEWRRFVGDGIPYERTCPHIGQGK
jgi:WD40 repeat protein